MFKSQMFKNTSDFDIRISDFRLLSSAFRLLSSVRCPLSAIRYKFMQNKPSLPAAEMDINNVLTENYEYVRLAFDPKTNPIRPKQTPGQALSFLESSNREPISPHCRVFRLFALAGTEKIIVFNRLSGKFRFRICCRGR